MGSRATMLCAMLGLLLSSVARGDEPFYSSELVFPLRADHNHAPSLVECSNGDLLCSWYRGSGERTADDVAVYGARLRQGESQWSEAFLLADYPGFPDCNTAMMIDDAGKLWLFWPTIIANSWESCLTNFLVSEDYLGDGPPVWNRSGVIFMKPRDFSAAATEQLNALENQYADELTPRLREELSQVRERLSDKLFQRLGWQPRCKPTVLPSGRILLPLYTDTFSLSVMAISDDGGQTWYSGQPTLGFGAIQPSVVRRNDGTLVAFMRENGPHNRVRMSESEDEGLSWSRVVSSDLPNPGSGVDALRLANGNWIIVYNDREEGEHDRSSLAISLSTDEGRTWTATRHLEQHDAGAYHYPAVIQSSDGKIHICYSYFTEGGKSMKHVAVNEAWIRSPE